MTIEKKNAKQRAVADTNILISAFVYPSGIVRSVIKGMLQGRFDMGLSEEIYEEFIGVLKSKFKWPNARIEPIISFLRLTTIKVEPSVKINAPIKDKSDNIILECAVEFNADYIITGDKELQSLGKYEKTKIISPADFILLHPEL